MPIWDSLRCRFLYPFRTLHEKLGPFLGRQVASVLSLLLFTLQGSGRWLAVLSIQQADILGAGRGGKAFGSYSSINSEEVIVDKKQTNLTMIKIKLVESVIQFNNNINIMNISIIFILPRIYSNWPIFLSNTF